MMQLAKDTLIVAVLLTLGANVALASHTPDLNGDGKVDEADLAIFKTQFNTSGSNLSADFNHNGGVGVSDAGILFSAWGTLPTEPPPPPPPPPSGTRDPGAWPFDSLSAWNRPVGSGATYQSIQSATTGGGFTGSYFNYKAWTVAMWFSQSSDPLRNVYLNGVFWKQIRIPDSAEPSPDQGDADMLVISPDHLTVYEFYRAVRRVDGDFDVANAAATSLKGLGDKGIVTNGMSLAGGNIRAGELKNGVNHVLAFTAEGTMWNRNAPGGRTFVWPARWADSCAARGECYGTTGNLHMGSWVALPPEITIDTLGLETNEGRNMARALQNYGAIGTTTGGVGTRIVFRIDYAAYKAGDLAGIDLTALQRDMNRIAPKLKLVSDSHNSGFQPAWFSDSTQGVGGGTPLAPLAPPFDR